MSFTWTTHPFGEFFTFPTLLSPCFLSCLHLHSPFKISHTCAKSLRSHPTLGDPMDCNPPNSSVHEFFFRQEHWNELLCPSPGDLPDPGFEPMSHMSPALAGGFFTTSGTWETL